MPYSLDLHQPLLINTVGHSIGILIFGILLVLLVRESWARGLQSRRWPLAATSLALLWNAGSLAALVLQTSKMSTQLIASLSFSALSALPAVLLAVALGPSLPWLKAAGFLISAIAVCLHLVEVLSRNSQLHHAALILVSVGFSCLAVATVMLSPPGSKRSVASRVVAPICLFLLAISFVHFETGRDPHLWSEELAFHHAGIPIALLILLRDLRLLLLDTYTRFLASACLAGLFTIAVIEANFHWRLTERGARDPVIGGLLVVGAGCALSLFASGRTWLQQWITRTVFRRKDLNESIQQLVAGKVPESVESVAAQLARFVDATAYEEIYEPTLDLQMAQYASAVHQAAGVPPWAEVLVPLRFSNGESVVVALGRRAGGRRYLSEDMQDLSQLAAAALGHVERSQTESARRLASEAELRALQSQINPHFLFNSLNALYGAIPRQAEAARRTVLNLADIFRYSLESDKSMITVAEEVRIIRAYLAIEQLRLGERLAIVVEVDGDVESETLPALSVQPLVENAVKHGVASEAGPGWVHVTFRAEGTRLQVLVRDSGAGFLAHNHATRGNGVGLENVRQRLRLRYRKFTDIAVAHDENGTTVSFEVPRSSMDSGRSPSVPRDAAGIRT